MNLGAKYGSVIFHKLPASVPCMVMNAFKITVNLKPLVVGGRWNSDPSVIEGLMW
jgi:hypothetical protein